MRTIILFLCLAVVSVSFAGKRPDEWLRRVNAPPPDWLAIGAPIPVELVKNMPAKEPTVFHSRSGEATRTHNKVKIPKRGIEFTVPREIYEMSLNPDGTKLIVNEGGGGGTFHLYEILSDGRQQEVPLRVPSVTYDKASRWGDKGFIYRWSWASNDVLIGEAEIADEREELIELRLYAFFLKDQILSQLDLSKVQQSSDDYIEVIGIGADLKHMKLKVGEREMLVKVNLTSPPKIVTPRKDQSTPPTVTPTVPASIR